MAALSSDDRTRLSFDAAGSVFRGMAAALLLLALTLNTADTDAPRVISGRGITVQVPKGWHLVGENDEIERVRSFEKKPDGTVGEVESGTDRNVLEMLKYEEPIPRLNVGIVIGVEPFPDGLPRDPFMLARVWCDVTAEQGVGTRVVEPPKALTIDERPAGLCHTSGTVVGGGRPMRSLRWSYFISRVEELIHIEVYCPPDEREALMPIMKAFIESVRIAETREL